MISARKIYLGEDPQTSDETDNHQKVDINSLDYDSLAQIFMLLPIAERMDMEKVCTKWKEAAPLAWCNIKKYKCETSIGRSYDNRLMTQSYLEKILLICGFHLNELTLSNICHSSIMPFVGDHCKNLTRLEFEFDDNPSTPNTIHFVQAFTLLDKLKYIRLKVNNRYFDKTFNLFEIVRSLPEEIKEIHLYSRCKYRRQETDSMIFKKFNNLQKLTVRGSYLDNMIFQEIAEKKTLVHLDIELYHIHNGFNLFDKLVNLENINLFITVHYWTNEEVTKDLTSKVLKLIFCTCKNLKHLDMDCTLYHMTEIFLNKSINLQNLQHLGLSYNCRITPDLANKIVEYCKNLKHLSICETSHYALEILTKLKNLESLIINGDANLTEKSITAISNNCKKLNRLKISNCSIVPSINGDPLSSSSVLDELSKLQYLEHLDLMFARNLKDSTIIAVANNCKNLKYLNIRGASTITETAFDALTNLKNLQLLYVCYLERITDNSIIKLKGLKEMYCSGCTNLTDTGIIQLIKNNPDLQELNASHIDNITIDSIIAADEATKNRTNGIILHMMITPLKVEAFKLKNRSQWLIIT